MLGPVLRTGSVDTTDPGAAWFRAALAKDNYLALTDRGRYAAAIACAALVTEVLLALTGSASAL